MGTNHSVKLGEKVKESLEVAQARLAMLEEEAQRVVAASRKELGLLLTRLHAQDLFDRTPVKEWSDRAKLVGEDVAHRLEELRERMVTFMGVASREQVEELARDLEKLTRKVDRALVQQPARRPAREAKKA